MSNELIGVLLDYIRMVAYGAVLSASLVQLRRHQYKGFVLVGDIFFSGALIVVLAATNFMHYKINDVTDFLLTPTSIIWAILHFISLNKIDGKEKTL